MVNRTRKLGKVHAIRSKVAKRNIRPLRPDHHRSNHAGRPASSSSACNLSASDLC
jgi:hypothetical protein